MAEHQYICTRCRQTYEPAAVRYLCPACSAKHQPGQPLEGVLETTFNYADIAARINPDAPDWSLLCAVDARFHPPFAVGHTPLTRAPRLEEQLGLPGLWVKNDGLNPSGSLKDRASFLVVAHANAIGESTIVAASTGNAASSLAAVCASAGMRAVIFVPATAPRAKLVQMKLYGADVRTVDGTYDDAFQLSLEYTEREGGLNRNTAFHPLTIEGKKTVSLELFEQMGGTAPDSVVVPVGDGVIIAGVAKGFDDLRRIGLIDKLPRLIAVQAARSDAIHHLIKEGTYRSAEQPETVADSVSVSTPSNAWAAADAVRSSGGFSITVSDAEILDAQKLLAETTGIYAEPAAASTLAGTKKALSNNPSFVGTTVLLVTGHGLKDVDATAAFLR